MSFLRSSLYPVILSNLATISNYLCMILLSRGLSKGDYAGYAALSALLPVMTSWSGLFPYRIVDWFNKHKNSNQVEHAIIRIFMHISGISFIFTLIIFIFSDFFTKFLGLSNYYLIPTYTFTIFFVLLNTSLSGFLLASGKYASVYIRDVILSVSKLTFFSIVIFYIDGYLYQIVISELLSVLIAIVFTLYLCRGLVSGDSHIISGRYDLAIIKSFWHFDKNVLAILSNMLIVGVFISGDIVLANYLFKSDIVGDYAVASNFSKIIIYCTAALSSIIYPYTVKLIHGKKDTSLPVIISISTCIFFGGLITTISTIFSEEIILYIFGSKYIESRSILPLTCVLMTLISNNVIFFNYFLARKKYGYIIFTILLFVFIFLIFTILKISLATIFELCFLYIGVSGFIFVFSFFYFCLIKE